MKADAIANAGMKSMSVLRLAKSKESWKIATERASPVLVGGLNAFLSRYWERSQTAGLAMEFLENQQVGFKTNVFLSSFLQFFALLPS